MKLRFITDTDQIVSVSVLLCISLSLFFSSTIFLFISLPSKLDVQNAKDCRGSSACTDANPTFATPPTSILPTFKLTLVLSFQLLASWVSLTQPSLLLSSSFVLQLPHWEPLYSNTTNQPMEKPHSARATSRSCTWPRYEHEGLRF